MPLPADGELTYNGYTFDGSAKVLVSSQPVRDRAARTVIYRMITITVEAVIAANTETDESMETIRGKLAEDGQKLTFINKGFGTDIIVNKGKVRDVKWGPKTQELSWTPIGSNYACVIIWQVDVCLPECACSGCKDFTGIMAFNYQTAFDIDDAGLSTRVVQGYIEIAQTRTAGKRVPDCADYYRDLLSIPELAGFKREQSWRLSLDGSTLEFTIRDQEIDSDNPYPPGVIDIRATHSVSWRRPGGDANGDPFQIGTINVRIHRSQKLSATRMYHYFLLIAAQRFSLMRRRGLNMMLQAFTIEEDIFGREATFSLTYRVLSALEHILKNHSLFEPVSGVDWLSWKNSLIDGPFSNRGYKKLRQDSSGDQIVDLCRRHLQVSEGQGVPLTAFRSGVDQAVRFRCPPPAYSFLRFRIRYSADQSRPVYVGHPIQDAEKEIDLGGIEAFSRATGNLSLGKKAGKDSVIQTGGRARYMLRVFFDIIRVCYPIKKPRIKKWGKQKVTEKKAHITSGPVGTMGNLRVFRLTGYIDYVVSNAPEDYDQPDESAVTDDTAEDSGSPF